MTSRGAPRHRSLASARHLRLTVIRRPDRGWTCVSKHRLVLGKEAGWVRRKRDEAYPNRYLIRHGTPSAA